MDVKQWARDRPCEACHWCPPSDPAHFRSVGASGADTKENLLSLCRPCHSMQHQSGIKTFWKKFGERIQKQRNVTGEPLIKVYWELEDGVTKSPGRPKRASWYD